MVEVTEKYLKISELFEIKLGDGKYTKKYCSNKDNQGVFPLYSGKTEGAYAYIKKYDFSGNFLSWSKDGLAGFLMYHENEKFSITNHRGILILREKYSSLNLKYLKILLEPVFRRNIKGRLASQEKNEYTTLSKEMILAIEEGLSIPVDKNGDFDLDVQEEIVRKYELIESRKVELAEKIKQIKAVEVDILSGGIGKSISIKVSDLFDLTVSTNSSKFTKTFVKENSGNIPVYGASSDDVPSYGYVEDNAVIFEKESGRKTAIKYFEDCLTYNIDGLAGYVFYREGRFTLSEKVRPLIVKDKYKDYVEPLYLKQILETVFRANIKGRKGENGKNEYTKLNTAMIKDLEVFLPVDSTGKIDLDKQIQIVKNAQTIASMKKAIECQGYQFIQSNLKFNSDGTPYIYIYNHR